ncbi:unnamed protein product [Laminaria digitata]
MVTARFLRAAGACLTMCPVVMCGGERGDGRTLPAQSHRRSGDSSAWISHPPSHSSLRISGPTSTTTSAVTSTSPWESATASELVSARGRSWVAAAAPSTSKLFYASRDQQNAAAASAVARPLSSPMPPWLARRRPGRGRGEGGFQLGMVAAVRSPGDGAAAATAAVGGGGEELEGAYEAAVGEDGLLGLDGFRALADVRELLEDGLLQDSEVLAIWEAVPKAGAGGDRVDFRGFCQAFARVDALFEEEEEEDKAMGAATAAAAAGPSRGGGGDGVAPTSGAGDGDGAEASFVELAGSVEGVVGLSELLRWSEVTELLEEGLVAREEVEQMWEGLPKAANSVEAAGVAGVEKGTLINFQGFLEFDRQLSDLFEDEETGADASADEQPAAATATATATTTAAAEETAAAAAAVEAEAAVEAASKAGASVEKEAVAAAAGGGDGTTEGKFSQLSAAKGGLLTLGDLLGWSEVSELLQDELLTSQELDSMFEGVPKAGDGSSIDLAGFVEFARKLDDMFEDDAEDDGNTLPTSPQTTTESTPPPPASSSRVVAAQSGSVASSPSKKQPLPAAATAAAAASKDAASNAPVPLPTPPAAEAVAAAAGGAAGAAKARARLVALAEAEMVDCGMGCGEDKRAQMLEALDALVAFEEGNLVAGDGLGTGLIPALEGEWRLLYTSSNAMEYNQGLTGLANTIPNAKFRGLRQILHADGMVFDAEYEEELSIRDESEPLVITVTSDWEVKQTSSLVTGKSSVAIAVAPKQIKYGFITVRSERWKTLRAMMLLDIAYLDDDIRIMRGQTARQNFFVFSRV